MFRATTLTQFAMSVHFKDADGVVHSIPKYLIAPHFAPNDPSDPYVLESITVAYASGAKKEHRVHRDYFDALVALADETAPTYPGNFVPGLQMGEFVRFVGSRRAIPAITNYLLEHGTMATILLHSLRGVWKGPFVSINSMTSQDSLTFIFQYGDGDEIEIVCSSRDEYVATLSTIVDECQHYREIVDFVRDVTNERYAKKLQPFMTSITGYANGVLYHVNPLTAQFTMGWFARELCKVPQHVIDKWIDDRW